MARRAVLTTAGLLAESYGERPYTVTLREEKAPGTNVVLDYTVEGGARKKRTLGYPVRRLVGKRWEWDGAALDRAREAAEDRSAQLRLARLRDEALTPKAITFAEAVALYTDETNGGLPPDPLSRREYVRTLKRWTGHFGADRPWNAIRRSEVDGWAKKRQAEGKVPTAVKEIGILRALTRWLDEKAGLEGLSNPVKGFDWKKLKASHTVSRPRYTADEMAAIVKVRHDVDPRFALFLALMDDSGARGKAIRITMRSAVDVPIEHAPSEEEAPYGWVLFPALKGQRAPLHLLTAFERRELDLALTGYLRDLEARWQEEGVDYPLFPGARIKDKARHVIGVDQPGSDRCASASACWKWLREAERVAKVEHVDRRALHGVRRLVSDLMYRELGLDAMTTAMGWSSRTTPEQIYIDQRRMKDRIDARKAMERKRADS